MKTLQNNGRLLPIASGVLMALMGQSVMAYTSEDGTLQVDSYYENATFQRRGVGLSKFRNTLQSEFSKQLKGFGPFQGVSLNGTLRATYDGVYDINSDSFGNDAGGPIQLENVAGGDTVPYGGGIPLPGGGLEPGNVNDGLEGLGDDLHPTDGGVGMGVPVRPCDKDSRGCIKGYMDDDLNDLRFSEFNDRLDFIRELYLDASIPTADGGDWGFRIGKQQVIWGRTDLFRVLDVLNPVDYSRHNIYDELEDIRIPMWMMVAEKHFGATETFDDLNFQLVWNFDKFRPSKLGQGGSPYAILDAGSFFRAMNNCWDNGCTVANFAGGVLATNFPKHVIGIRQANLPDWSLDNTQLGLKVEGEYKGVGFSLNALTYRSQLPVLRGGIPADNPFTVPVESQPYPYLIAFDIDFPRVNLVGGSLDFYVDGLKSVFRVESAYTSGEEFANTLRPRLFSENNVLRTVIGWDRNTFIPFLNEKRAFLLSAQVFWQHIFDHERATNANNVKMGIPDPEDNAILTFLIKGWYMNDRLSPQLIIAHDVEAQATVLAPAVEWQPNDHLKLTFGANIKVGDSAQKFDDCRGCNPFAPFTGPVGGEGDPSLRIGGYEPLGRFSAGPIGMAQNEDEVQLTVRYSF
ncbi:DUF1302 family protein [Thiolapillus brandeum]|nr:DUF1302 family protein [Thiolapillus brandeum]